MARLRVVAGGGHGERLRAAVAAIQAELGVPEAFPTEVLADAQASATDPVLPEHDRTDLPLLTIDPLGARDLDQAMCLERAGSGYVVWYAIADVAAFVRPGSPTDLEAHRRGETLYAPEHRVPLHPPVLSEAAGSLLPDQVRPALLWRIELDGSGERTGTDVRRALVRSRAQYDYLAVQQALDVGQADEMFELLREIGTLLQAREDARGGVSLPTTDQEIDVQGDVWTLAHRAEAPVEGWNAQISLLTGMAAADLMLSGEIGLLRTLPEADERDIARLQRTAAALGIDWPPEMPAADFVRTLDPSVPQHAAMAQACTRLFRGAAYVAFDGQRPEQPRHAAIAAEYAHVTAPLRRLADRYAGEVCLAICAGEPVPAWVSDALPGLPGTMRDADGRASAFDRAVVDAVEAGLLTSRIGTDLEAVVVSLHEDDPTRGVVVIDDPAVEAPLDADRPLPLGGRARLRVVATDVEARTVTFELL
ncbi:MAG: 3'-to-5' exoribonuclease RNase R [uncultured Nocardioidaceae bacterium]|uniref:3'-to-5' exoribonuclease RNase R n=1 Tax=uncultured Nocardioidaceae bacterium TaxID=253824 RepID=A0A6J4LJ97_9ACTN|nr:MAG: 3'-to-5' exoribonuclease RNase R [uncultured Nocardioidaceae bacterium]